LRHNVGRLVGELEPFSDTLRDTTKDFSQIASAFEIRSFVEQKPTRLPPPEGDQLVGEVISPALLKINVAIDCTTGSCSHRPAKREGHTTSYNPRGFMQVYVGRLELLCCVSADNRRSRGVSHKAW
jgi:hypothetical protein